MTLPFYIRNYGSRELIIDEIYFKDASETQYGVPVDVGVKGKHEGGGHTGEKTENLLIPNAIDAVTDIDFSYDGKLYSCTPSGDSVSLISGGTFTFFHTSDGVYELYNIDSSGNAGATIACVVTSRSSTAKPYDNSWYDRFKQTVAQQQSATGDDYIEGLYATNGFTNDDIGCFGEDCRNVAVIADHQQEDSGIFYVETGGSSGGDSQSSITATIDATVTDTAGNSNDIAIPLSIAFPGDGVCGDDTYSFTAPAEALQFYPLFMWGC
ncbi:MAG: hypothetical protein ACO2ZM_07525 [Francisellaceae bacterium]